ncbi:amidohydrolase 2 [Aspergillus uvarum CBS 121591]|uniref:Amidohydrolase 2 n=1 Tax=Aspergillus uvarum CBS 121591 TaxID=1448315 RepID=A0A319DPB1_9EURO|nr:amidohydrolase 2 [Aspergillus uvarum CBS 121591]PYH81132.1 amidohydrolase 2 [Aspergillus uvarum CBS 121591]
MPKLIYHLAAFIAAVTQVVLAHTSLDSQYRIDVHSHPVPQIWLDALIEEGYPTVNGSLIVEGFPVPDWTLTGHLQNMDSYGVNYSTLSVTTPGVYFLASKPQKAKRLARELNNLLHNYTQSYPTRLGALCLLPLPNVADALEEIKYCLDTLHFDGIGFYTNYNGLYLGDATLDPVFAALNQRRATVFVHPATPGCADATLGYGGPLTEYPFDSVRAMENMLLTGQRARYPNVTMIYPHGGGAMPYLAGRIAGVASLPALGALNPATVVAQLKGYYFDTASAYSAIQLQALKAFIGVGRIVTGTDFPYVPVSQAKPGLASIQANGNFTEAEMAQINHQNALAIFPRIAAKLGLRKSG